MTCNCTDDTEIRFVLSLMQTAKQIGDSFDQFKRKKEDFENLMQLKMKINENIVTKQDRLALISQLLEEQILSQNEYKFSKILHLLSNDEMDDLRNDKNVQTLILNKIEENKWLTGGKIFNSFVDDSKKNRKKIIDSSRSNINGTSRALKSKTSKTWDIDNCPDNAKWLCIA